MAESSRLGEIFLELADTLVSDFDVVDFMTTLAYACVELLSASEVGVLLADEGGRLHSVGSSSEAARLLDLFEIQNDEGPCLDCFRTGAQIINQSLREPSNRWPTFSVEARRLGYQVVHALPMRLRGDVIGAVNVFSTDDGPLTQSQVDVGQALADVATVGLLQERSLRASLVLNEQLRGALQSRIVIEQAKGMLAERRQIDTDVAFDLIRRYARGSSQRLRDVATAVLDGSIPSEALDPR